jgi:hypothetical protein
MSLERLGLKRGMLAEWYKHLRKEVGGRVYQAWIEVTRIETMTGRKVGWMITLGVQVDNEELLVRLAERMNQILEDLKKEGYVESKY